MHINEVEQKTGITKKNIRFYEKEGLLNPARNGENGYREYSNAEVDALISIKLLRKLDVPVADIRTMMEGKLSVAEGMQRHQIVLLRKQQNIDEAKNLCDMLCEEQGNLSTLDSEQYLEKMQKLEQSGTGFIDIAKHDVRTRYIAPIIIASVVVLFCIAYMAFLIWAFVFEQMPVAIFIFMLIFPLLLASGVGLALRQRVNEIKKGDDADAIGKY